jgi:hypothetical protein
VNTSQSISHSRRITWLETRLPWRVSPVEQELITLQGHLRLHPVFSGGFSGVRLTRSLVLCACFITRCLSFCNFSFGHFVVYSSSIYGFRLPLWYLLPHPAFSGVCVAQGLVVYLMLYRYVFVPLSFFFWTLIVLSVDFRIMINPVVASNMFYYEYIRAITKLPNSEQSYNRKGKTHKYIDRQNQSTTGKLWKP